MELLISGQIGSTLVVYLGGGGGQQSGAGQIGSAVGGIAGNILLPGIGGHYWQCFRWCFWWCNWWTISKNNGTKAKKNTR